jgi:hypothetical protein
MADCFFLGGPLDGRFHAIPDCGEWTVIVQTEIPPINTDAILAFKSETVTYKFRVSFYGLRIFLAPDVIWTPRLATQTLEYLRNECSSNSPTPSSDHFSPAPPLSTVLLARARKLKAEMYRAMELQIMDPSSTQLLESPENPENS